MSRFSTQVIQDVPRNFESIDTSCFNKNEREFPQHLLENIQEFIPIYNRFIDDNTNTQTPVMCLNHRYHVVNGTQVFDRKENQSQEQEFFVKFSPLLDPLRYMIGKYDQYGEHITKLPSMKEKHVIAKLDDVNNCAYTDGFFYYLSSRLQEISYFPHGIDYLGSVLAIQKYFKIDVEDDLEYLSGSVFSMRMSISCLLLQIAIMNHMGVLAKIKNRLNLRIH